MKCRLLLLVFGILLLGSVHSYGQVAAWNFAGVSSPATQAATFFHPFLDSSNLVTRGPGAAASAATNSFRTTGFQNNGIATTNTDYFEVTLSVQSPYTLSLTTIDARLAGTATFAAAPGVSNQFAYSLDGTNFTLIGSPEVTVGQPVNLTQIDLTGIAALQNLSDTVTVYIRYYASGQTTTGGWGFAGSMYAIGANITAACTPPATPSGTSITGTTPACNSTTLTYTGAAPPANVTNYWQFASATGTSTVNDASIPLTASASGNYYVRAKNTATGCWSTTSYGPYAVVINTDPVITSQPSNASVAVTTNATFTVVATSAGTYQWQESTDGGATYNDITDGGIYSNATTASLTLTGVTLGMNGYKYQCFVSAAAPCTTPTISTAASLTVTSLYSSASDIISGGGEPLTISSTVNNVTIASSTDGVQVWSITIRDGGVGLNDADTAPTILTAFNIAQFGNTVNTWSSAIFSIGLFDGTTLIANGIVTATQIQFTGLNVVVADGTQKTLTLRLSLKCPMTTGVLDGDHFGFSINSGANSTFSASGSGKLSGFPAATSNNAQNTINIVATKLAFTVQPTNTGQNNTMSTVSVSAVDACGNIDLGFTGIVSLSSTGTMTGAPLTATAVAGVATFSTIVHTATGTGLTLSASSGALTPATSTTFTINAITLLQPGDIAILAFSTAIASGDDEISFVTFVDIEPGTRIDMTDNAYQKCGTPNGWGISEGWIRIERANSLLPKGTIITVNVNSAGVASVVSPDPANWVCTKPQPASQGTFNLNNTGEQIFFLSGGTVGGTNASTATSDGGTYSGSFLYGFNTKGNVWTPICGNSAAGGTQNSDKPKNFDCFLTWPTAQADLDKYTGPTTPATQRDWVARISDSANWTGYANLAAYNLGPNYYGASISILVGGYSAGVWIGDKDTNWFECSNWQSRKVPDATVNVSVGTNAVQGVTVDATATNASAFSFLAQCKDLAISTFNVKVEGSASNILEVNGNLAISSSGTLDMDDSNSATADGRINLYGNWTNTVGNTAFSEGNGTVNFTGTGTQVIGNVAPEGTETFYNVILNNNFDTALSNDVIATNTLTVNAAKTFSIDSAGYARADTKLSNNGNMVIENGGQLIQVNDTDTNDGDYSATKFQVKKIALAKDTDYIYWSSPINSFATASLPTDYRYIWNTTYNNTNGTQGNWNATPGGSMVTGKGYIARASNGASSAAAFPVTFTGSKPNNGLFNFTVYRGNYTGVDYDADLTDANNAWTTKYDDNWNLVGNPYPSAIDAEKFLVLNQSVIEGSVWIWKHGLLPNSTTSPFYSNFQYNYSDSDYIKYNGLGSSEPDTFAGEIASGQGFMVTMKDVGSLFATGASTALDVYSSSIAFNNSLRSDSTTNPYTPYNNTDFYKMSGVANTAVGNPIPEEKHRIWLDITNNATHQSDGMLVGYSTNSTVGRDNFYDCFFIPRSEVSIYSLIDQDSFVIQGRPLPFNSNDRVPIGINIVSQGNHTIGIKKVDGLFVEGTPVYLEDKVLNVIHDLKESPYVFTSEKGKFNDRFVLRYTNEALGNPDFETLNNSVVAATNHGQLVVTSSLEMMQEVLVYDLLGRELFKASSVNSNEFTATNISMSHQTLILKVRLEDGTVVTRKIIL